MLRRCASSQHFLSRRLALPLYTRFLDHSLGVGSPPTSPSSDPVADLEAAVRPALTPTGALDDLDAWRHNLFFLAWLRSAYLDRKHCASPALAEAEQLHALRPDALLRFSRACELFGLDRARASSGAWRPNPPDVATRRMRRLRDRARADGRIDGWSLEDVIEAAGGCVAGRGPFNVFCERHHVHEFLTLELVDALADRLAASAKAAVSAATVSNAGSPGTPTVAEIGAGSGHLAFHLGGRLAERGVRFFASDARPRRSPFSRSGRVDAECYRTTLQRRRPHVVLCAWMPMGVDWTEDLRRAGVFEYLLLGEADNGNCGHNWRTFGNPAFADGAPADGAGRISEPPFSADGYDKSYLDDLSRLMLQRFDSEEYPSGSSRAVAFRRRPNE
jgi:hypothetical protein